MQAYQHVDPANVPPTRITGPARLTPASVPMLARVAVPTDAGVYLVILTRNGDNPTWLADRILPPEGAEGPPPATGAEPSATGTGTG